MTDTLELAVIGDILLEGLPLDRVRSCCRDYKLEPKHFTDKTLGEAYEILLNHVSNDRAMLIHAIKGTLPTKLLHEVLDAGSPSFPNVEAHIRELSRTARIKEGREGFENLCSIVGDASPETFAIFARDYFEKMAADERGTSKAPIGFNFNDLGDAIPEAENPDAILSRDYLHKGGGLVLASVTGSGKSVLSIQFAYAFALGREVLGLRPVRPMKIGIFQTEDDTIELREFRDSMRRGFREFHHWTEGDIVAAEANIRFYPTDFASGKEFVDRIRDVQRQEHCDLVILNPLQAICGCNLTEGREKRDFTTSEKTNRRVESKI